MPLNVNSVGMTDINVNSVAMEEVRVNGTTVWRLWNDASGSKNYREHNNANQGVPEDFLVYDSGYLTFDRNIKITEFTLFSKVIRKDITGRISGKFVIDVQRPDGSTFNILTYASETSVGSPEWSTIFTKAVNNNTEVKAIRYRFYVVDAVRRQYEVTMSANVTKWKQKN